MEAVPKLPMLRFELKTSPDNTDFIQKLKMLIRTHYNEDPDAFVKELDEIGRLRSQACIRPNREYSGIANIKRYYCQIHLIQSRFKIKGDEEGPFQFSWYDAYSGQLYKIAELDYEMASVLYNLGSLHCILGAGEPRSDSDSMKVACTHFQCAAWAFHTLPDRYSRVYSTDIAPELLAALSQMCLAQAQECILEKSILDGRKSSIIAKVGVQVSEYYVAALRKLECSNNRLIANLDVMTGGLSSSSPAAEETIVECVGYKVNKLWMKHLEFKVVYYASVALLYCGIHAEECQKMGDRIAYYQKASDKLAMCAKLAPTTAAFKDCLNFTDDVIRAKLENAKKENEFVYHEKVPDFDSLPELKGASLVNGIGFDVTDPDVAGDDIFARLVPLETHEASSLYSEEKAKLLRIMVDEVEEKNAALAIFMSSLSLDEEVPKPEEHLQLPQELIEVAAGLSVKNELASLPPTVQLHEAMARISDVSLQVEATLKEIRVCLKEEKEQELEYSTMVLDGGKRPSPICDEIARECGKYEEAHQMASESNVTLHNAMKLHLDNLKLLSLPLEQLQKKIPSLADLDEESESNIAEVRRMMAKVEEMRSQRSLLMEQFRQELMEDDITAKLVSYHQDGDQLQVVFERELLKHDKTRQIISQNLTAQNNILQALTQVNARYASTRRVVSEIINNRNDMIGSLVASYYAHEDLLHKAAKGLEFYDKLDTNVNKLFNRVRGVVKVQQEERRMNVVLTANHAVQPLDNGYKATAATAAPTNPNSSQPTTGSSSTARPTLKDYLKMMKETNTSASTAYAAINGGQLGNELSTPVGYTSPYHLPHSSTLTTAVSNTQGYNMRATAPSVTCGSYFKQTEKADHSSQHQLQGVNPPPHQMQGYPLGQPPLEWKPPVAWHSHGMYQHLPMQQQQQQQQQHWGHNLLQHPPTSTTSDGLYPQCQQQQPPPPPPPAYIVVPQQTFYQASSHHLSPATTTQNTTYRQNHPHMLINRPGLAPSVIQHKDTSPVTLPPPVHSAPQVNITYSQIPGSVQPKGCSDSVPMRPVVPQPQGFSIPECLERQTSLDDMLDEISNDNDATTSVATLQPKIITPGELAELKEEAKVLEDITKASSNDPYMTNPQLQEKLLKDVVVLEEKILSSPDKLNEKWKHLNSLLKGSTLAISVARCYPMKNRVPDVLPFDSSRVELPTTKDDYINASHVKHLSPHSPRFIVTQWPTANTLSDFWTLVWQEQVETIVCLLATPPCPQDLYWPTEDCHKREPLIISSPTHQQQQQQQQQQELEVTLQSIKNEKNWIERIFTVLNKSCNTSRVIIHLQMMAFNNQPLSVDALVKFSIQCSTYHHQQRVLTHPILVHCLEGSGRSATFLLLMASMAEIDVARETTNNDDALVEDDSLLIVPNLVKMSAIMCQQRKGVLRERQNLKHAYEGVLTYARNILHKNGVSVCGDHHGENQVTSIDVSRKSGGIFSPDLQKLADLSLNDQPQTSAGKSQKIRKQDFYANRDTEYAKENLRKKAQEEVSCDDPLSKLDPLWSLKK